jgi:hypothetical protein
MSGPSPRSNTLIAQGPSAVRPAKMSAVTSNARRSDRASGPQPSQSSTTGSPSMSRRQSASASKLCPNESGNFSASASASSSSVFSWWVQPST